MGNPLSKEEVRTKLHLHGFQYVKRSDGHKRFERLLGHWKDTENKDEIQRVLQKRNADGDTLFLVACAHGRMKTARLLLEKGARLNERNENTGYTALHQACSRAVITKMERNVQTLTFLLLDAKANPLIRDFLYRLPVHILQLDHIGKPSAALLRQFENIISPFAGNVKLEMLSPIVTTIGGVLGSEKGQKLSQQLGPTWRNKWCVVTRLRGGLTSNQYPYRCSHCYVFNVSPQNCCKNCKKKLPAAPPEKLQRYCVLTVYDNERSTRPLVIADLVRARIEYIDRAKMIKITLDSNLQINPDPMVMSSPELLR